MLRSLDGEQGPYQNVFLQEMDVMNTLLAEIVRSLKELLLGTGHPPTAHHHRARLVVAGGVRVMALTNGCPHDVVDTWLCQASLAS